MIQDMEEPFGAIQCSREIRVLRAGSEPDGFAVNVLQLACWSTGIVEYRQEQKNKWLSCVVAKRPFLKEGVRIRFQHSNTSVFQYAGRKTL